MKEVDIGSGKSQVTCLSIMKRLIFLNRFFFPDHSATSQILGDLAFHLAASGRDVHVITSQQLYDNPKAALPATEIVRGVHVHRVPTTQFGRSALLGRVVDYLSFYLSMWRSVFALSRPLVPMWWWDNAWLNGLWRAASPQSASTLSTTGAMTSKFALSRMTITRCAGSGVFKKSLWSVIQGTLAAPMNSRLCSRPRSALLIIPGSSSS
jgi:hypothetical protein